MLIAVPFVPNADRATATEYDRAADDNTRAFWMWAISAAFIFSGAPRWWWVAVPAVLAIYSAVAWLSCTRHARRLRIDTSRLSIRKNNVRREPAAYSPEGSKCGVQKNDRHSRSEAIGHRVTSVCRDLEAV